MSLQLSELQLGYEDRPILQNLSLPSITPGSLVALLGANAVGKSTLLKSLAGNLPYQGQARLNATLLHELSLAQRMQQIGYLPQTLPQPT